MPIQLVPWDTKKRSVFETGLKNLLDHKVQQMTADKMKHLLGESGYSQPQAEALVHAHKHYPEHVKELHHTYREQNKQRFDTQSAKTLEKNQKLMAKYQPEYSKLKEQRSDLEQMLDLAQNADIPFAGIQAGIASKIGSWGNIVLGGNKDAGTFQSLENKYVADKLGSSGQSVRSVAGLQANQSAKPSITRSREQNIKILEHALKQLDQREKDFLNAHPYFRDDYEIENPYNQPSQNQQEEQPQQSALSNRSNRPVNPASNNSNLPPVQQEVAKDINHAQQDIQRPQSIAAQELPKAKSYKDVENIVQQEAAQYTTPQNANIVGKLFTWGGQSSLLPAEFIPRAVSLMADTLNSGPLKNRNIFGHEVRDKSQDKNIFGQNVNNIRYPSDVVKDIGNTAFGNTQPEGYTERVINRAINAMPIVMATGGLNLPAQFLNLLESGAVESVQGISDNPYIQLVTNIFAGVLARGGFKSVATKVNQIGSFKENSIGEKLTKPFLTPSEIAKRNAYTTADLEGSKFKVPSVPIHQKIESFLEDSASKFDLRKAEYDNLVTKVAPIFKTLNGPDVSGQQIRNAQRLVNKYLKRSDLSAEEYKAYKGLSGVMKDVVSHVGQDNAQWGQSLEFSNKLHQLQNWQYGLSNTLGKYASKKAIRKILGGTSGGLLVGSFLSPSTAQLLGIPIGGIWAGGEVLKRGIIKPALFLDYLAREKSGQGLKLLSSLVVNGAKESAPAIIANIKDLNKLAQKYQEEEMS